MRSLTLVTAASLWLLPLLAWSGEKPAKPTDKAEPSGSCGTSIDFFDSPQDAAKQALKDQKLVFVVHVSGNFEDPRFT